ncbi:type II secretion system protein GspM [Tropicibacter oceani]|uniref:Type II secretion system protein GspM n=1 Tax=Tropicibacter oceani TaxID=3058420 RepID=A0ABY8QPE4_9RHOB|nr:type II secretion system protein GspM [Tropicibacter oceani]WGW05916.1 type II secretion system protein GspM [Tropicibacter oceani]
MSRLLDFLLKLSPRERVLLGVTVGAVLPLGLVLGILMPLQAARMQAETAQAEAEALRDWVASRTAEAQGLTRAVPTRQADPIGLSGIEEGLIAANLRRDLSSIGTESGGVIALRFDNVDFVRLATWLSSSHPDWGYGLGTLRLEDIGIPSRVEARIELRPPQD